jgi:hypothetical protein
LEYFFEKLFVFFPGDILFLRKSISMFRIKKTHFGFGLVWFSASLGACMVLRTHGFGIQYYCQWLKRPRNRVARLVHIFAYKNTNFGMHILEDLGTEHL